MANFFSASPEEQIDLLSVWWDKYKYLLGMLLAASVIFIDIEIIPYLLQMLTSLNRLGFMMTF